jgi:hypothetical protein
LSLIGEESLDAFPTSHNSDISVIIICNKTGGTIKGDIKKLCGYEWTVLRPDLDLIKLGLKVSWVGGGGAA